MIADGRKHEGIDQHHRQQEGSGSSQRPREGGWPGQEADCDSHDCEHRRRSAEAHHEMMHDLNQNCAALLEESRRSDRPPAREVEPPAVGGEVGNVVEEEYGKNRSIGEPAGNPPGHEMSRQQRERERAGEDERIAALDGRLARSYRQHGSKRHGEEDRIVADQIGRGEAEQGEYVARDVAVRRQEEDEEPRHGRAIEHGRIGLERDHPEGRQAEGDDVGEQRRTRSARQAPNEIGRGKRGHDRGERGHHRTRAKRHLAEGRRDLQQQAGAWPPVGAGEIGQVDAIALIVPDEVQQEVVAARDFPRESEVVARVRSAAEIHLARKDEAHREHERGCRDGDACKKASWAFVRSGAFADRHRQTLRRPRQAPKMAASSSYAGAIGLPSLSSRRAATMRAAERSETVTNLRRGLFATSVGLWRTPPRTAGIGARYETRPISCRWSLTTKRQRWACAMTMSWSCGLYVRSAVSSAVSNAVDWTWISVAAMRIEPRGEAMPACSRKGVRAASSLRSVMASWTAKVPASGDRSVSSRNTVLA